MLSPEDMNCPEPEPTQPPVPVTKPRRKRKQGDSLSRSTVPSKPRKSRTYYSEAEDLASGSVLGRGQAIQPQTVEVILRVYQFFLKLIEGEGPPIPKVFMLSCLDDVYTLTSTITGVSKSFLRSKVRVLKDREKAERRERYRAQLSKASAPAYASAEHEGFVQINECQAATYLEPSEVESQNNSCDIEHFDVIDLVGSDTENPDHDLTSQTNNSILPVLAQIDTTTRMTT